MLNIAIAIMITAYPCGIDISVGCNIGLISAFSPPNIIISSIVVSDLTAY